MKITKETKEKLFNFLEDDLIKLEKNISNKNEEKIENFFSYWNIHLKKLK